MFQIKMQQLEFEVHGKVQGVFFRKYTKKEADRLHLTGWVMNTSHKTVIGVAEGQTTAVNELQSWLAKKGSPKSRIDKLDVKSTKTIDQPDFNEFTIRR